MKLNDDQIVEGLQNFDERITKEYFYGVCFKAYNLFHTKYQLRWKTGLDFYSLAHEYYIHLMTHQFKPLLDKPKEVALTSWMTRGFQFVVLDALKAYNREIERQELEESEEMLSRLREDHQDDDMLQQVVDAVCAHYHSRSMTEMAHLILVEGYKQKEVADELHITPAAVNIRYKKMMRDVVKPFVEEYYGRGIASSAIYETDGDVFQGVTNASGVHFESADFSVHSIKDNESIFGKLSSIFDHQIQQNPMKDRTTPAHITQLKDHEIFVFGSNLRGLHAGGTARIARLQFGAIMGQGVGLQGQSYAIPTMQGDVDTIRPYVDEFIQFAQAHPELHFLVTPIGCGIAGFEPQDIAPLFEDAMQISNIWLPESFWKVLLEK